MPAELLLSCLRGDLTPSRAAAMTDDDWATLRRQGVAYQLRPMLHAQLSRSGITAPMDVAEDLRHAYRLTAAANLRIFHQLGSVLAAMSADRIDVLVLKGVYLAQFVYDHPALRPMRDLDLLVRRQDLARAVERLRELGYDAPPTALISRQCAAGAHLDAIRKQGASPLELHWNIEGPDSPYTVSPQELWDRSIPVSFGPGRCAAAALCREDLLLHLCLHGTRHATRDHRDLSVVKCVCDIAQVVRVFGAELDWRVVVNRARQWKAGHAVFLMLHLASEWLAAPVAADPLAELRPPSVTPVLHWARERILATPTEGTCPGDEPAAPTDTSESTSTASRARRLLNATGRWIRRRAKLQDRRAKNHRALRAWLHSSG